MQTYNINDVFTSVQGEGINTGIPATFIRAQGCPVGCPWCDSGPYYHPDLVPVSGLGGLDTDLPQQHRPSKGNTWPGNAGKKMTEYDLVAHIPDNIMLVIITGGEPALQNWDAFINVLESIRGNHRHTIALETSGQYPWKGDRWPDWVTVSPKWSGMPWHISPTWWTYVREVKYVVDDHFEPSIVATHRRQCADQALSRADFNVVLMPEGCPPAQAHIDKCMEYALKYNWRVSDRLQYRWGVK